MKIYDEITLEEITAPDLSAGRLYEGEIITGHTEEYLEVMDGTVTESRPDGLRRLVPAMAITEPCQYYHTYTEWEKAAAAGTEQPSRLERLEAQTTYTAMMTDTLLEV